MEIENKKVIVTGGAGNIGSHVVDVLVEKGNQVTVVDDLSVGNLKKIEHHGSNINFIKADIRDKALMLNTIKDADVVFHLAVQCLRASIKDPFYVNDVNINGTLNLLHAATQNNIGKFVYISSSEAYGSAVELPMTENHPMLPTTPYGASKAAGEHLTNAFKLTYGLNTQIVRPFNAYGPRFDIHGIYGTVIPRFLVRALNNLPPIIYGDGEQTRDYTYVRDSAEGIVAAGEADHLKGNPVNISRGQPITVNKISEIVLDVTGKTNLKPEIYKPRPADVRAHWGANKKAKDLFGYEAKTDVKTGMKQYMEWLLELEKRQPGYLKSLLNSIPIEAW